MRAGFEFDYLQPARRDFEISTPCTVRQPGLAKISFSPMHSIAEKCLLTRWQQLRSLFRCQGEFFGESFNKIPNSDFTF